MNELTLCSLLGGALMLAVGVLYLLYDRSIMQSGQSEAQARSTNSISRWILGGQVRAYKSIWIPY